MAKLKHKLAIRKMKLKAGTYRVQTNRVLIKRGVATIYLKFRRV